MYSNVFDTTIFEDEIQQDINRANIQGMLYTSIISGLHPTLSLNQAVDSPALHKIMSAPDRSDFFKLIKNNTIRVARFRKPDKTYDNDAIDAYIIPKLQNQLYCEYSSLPFLNKAHKKYNEKQKVKILEELLSSYISNDLPTEKTFKTPDTEDACKLLNWVSNIKELKNSLNGRYLPYIEVELPDLSSMVLDAFSISIKDPHLAFCHDELNELTVHLQAASIKEDFSSTAEKNKYTDELNSRSGMYRMIRELRCNPVQERELMSIVDLKYNERVAKSISDNEDDVMVNNFENKCTEILLDSEEHTAKDDQKLYIVQNASGQDHEYITWALLNDILDTVKKKCNNSNDLNKRHSIMDDILYKRGIKSIIQKENNLILGDIHFALSTASSLCGFLSNSPIAMALSGAVLATGAVKMVYSRQQAKKDLEENDTLKGFAQAHKLLTQTSYLKHDYNNHN